MTKAANTYVQVEVVVRVRDAETGKILRSSTPQVACVDGELSKARIRDLAKDFIDHAFSTIRNSVQWTKLAFLNKHGITPEELEALDAGKAIIAVKLHRERTGASLRESKEKIDGARRDLPSDHPSKLPR